MTTKLLAVDDSKTMRKVLEITFAGDTYDSTVVGTAEEALGAARANAPQLAVIDAHLGASSGYELCKQLKAQLPGIRVMILSSKQRPFDAARGSSAGVDEHFDKPFDSNKFLDKLAALQAEASSAAVPGASPAAGQPPTAGQPPAEPWRPAEPQRPEEPQRPAEPQRAGEPQRAEEPQRAAGKPEPAAVSQRSAAPRPANDPVARSGGSGSAGSGSPGLSSPGLSGLSSPSRPSAVPRPQVSQPRVSSPAHAAAPARAPAATPAVAPTAAKAAPVSETASASSVAQEPRPQVAALTASSVDGSTAQMADRLKELGLTNDQMQGVLSLSREVVEQVVWEVVPSLAETLIKEEIARLTTE